MAKFLLYGHGGSYNHGAEAIVKCTIRRLREKYPNAYIILSSNFPEQDREFGVNTDEIIGPDMAAWTAEKSAPSEQKETLARAMYADALASVTPDTTLLSVGGDNFCYPNWHRLAVFQQEAVQKNAKSILWGCSVEPSALTPEMADVLGSYTHILARESRTYNMLRKHGINTALQLLPDPAFLLEPKPVELPDGFETEKIVGINISPLVIRKEYIPGIVKENFLNLINFILAETDMNVMLIPHVTMPMDNDYSALVELGQSLPSSFHSRVLLAGEKHSVAELKSLVSKCRLLVCARTHASIAAYSSGVPALVIGYSVKSKGIAEDLGLNEFVLDIAEIKSPYFVRDMFKYLNARTDEVKSNLNEKLPPYMAQINNYTKYI
jgi:polysaccharide pyruvyl transferase WcaK-like protein